MDKRITQCAGEGQGSCKRCDEKGIWNRNWMCFLYEVEGHEGCYCRKCAEEIIKSDDKLLEMAMHRFIKNSTYGCDSGIPMKLEKLTKTYIDEALDIIINNQITGLKLETSEKMFLMPLYNKLKELTK